MKKEAAEKKEAIRKQKEQLAADKLKAEGEEEKRRIQAEEDRLAFEEANTCNVCQDVIESPKNW